MKLEFKSDRDKDLYNVFEVVRKEFNYNKSIRDVCKIAVTREAESYYLTRKQIIQIITNCRCNPDLDTKKCNKQRYKDIFSRYWYFKKLYPEMSTSKIADLIDGEKAPRFYITDAHAVNIIYNYINIQSHNAVLNNPYIHSCLHRK